MGRKCHLPAGSPSFRALAPCGGGLCTVARMPCAGQPAVKFSSPMISSGLFVKSTDSNPVRLFNPWPQSVELEMPFHGAYRCIRWYRSPLQDSGWSGPGLFSQAPSFNYGVPDLICSRRSEREKGHFVSGPWKAMRNLDGWQRVRFPSRIWFVHHGRRDAVRDETLDARPIRVGACQIDHPLLHRQ